MAKTYKAGLLITGDAKGGVKAIKLTREELKKLNKSQQKTRDSSDKTKAKIGGLMAKLGGFGVVAGGATAAAALFASTLRTQSIRELQIMSDTLGVSVTAMSEWVHAGQKIGFEADKVGDIFKDIDDKIGDFAANGAGAAADIFNNLGLSIENIVNLPADKKLIAIAEGLEQVNSRAEKVFYLEALASDASRLLPLLENGAEGLKRAQVEARLLGTSLSDVDAAKVAIAGEHMLAFGDVTEGAANAFTIAMAPALSGFSSWFKGSVVELGGWQNAFTSVIDGIVSGIDVARRVLHPFHVLIKISETGWLRVGDAILKAMSNGGEAVTNVINGVMKPFQWVTGKIVEGFGYIIEGFGALTSDRALEGFGVKVQAAAKSIDKFKIETQDITNASEAMNKMLATSIKELEKLKNSTPGNEVQQKWEKLKDNILSAANARVHKTKADKESAKTSNKLLDDSIKKNSDYLKQLEKELALTKYTGKELAVQTALKKLNADATAEQKLRVRELTEALFDSKNGVSDYGKAWVAAIERIDSSFSDAWLKALSGKADKAFDGILSSFKRMLSEMLHLAITRPIILNIQQSLGLGGAGQASGAGGFGSLLNLFGGNGIGQGFANFGGFLGQKFGLYTNKFGGTLFNNAAGYSNMAYGAAGLLGGLFGSTAGGHGATGGSLGTTIGLAAAGPIGAVIGGVLGSAVGSLFGGKYKLHKAEARLDYSGGEFGGDIWTQERKKKLWKYRYREDSKTLDSGPINAIFDNVENAIKIAAEQFDITTVSQTIYQQVYESSADAGAAFAHQYSQLLATTVEQPLDEWLKNFSVSTNIDIKGLSKEEAQAKISEWVSNTTNSMITQVFGTFLTDMQKEGEALTATLQRVSTNMSVMQSLTTQLNLNFDLTGKAAATAATNIVDLVGGLDNLNQLSSQYYSTFFTQEEQFQRLQQKIKESLDKLGYSLPTTRDEFRALVESLDLSTEAGQKAYAQLMQLVPGMAQYFQYLEKTNTAVEDANKLQAQRLEFEKGISRSLAEMDMSQLQISLRNLDEWYQAQIKQAAALGADTTMLETLYGRRRQDAIRKALEGVNAESKRKLAALNSQTERKLSELTNKHNAAVNQLNNQYQKLFESINSLSGNIGDSVLSIRRNMSAWDEVAYQAERIGKLRRQLGQGGASDQVSVLERLYSATMARYQAEIDANNTLVNQHRERHKSDIANYQALKKAALSLSHAANGLLLSDLSPLKQGQKLSEAQKQFSALLAKARSGDSEAASRLSSAGNEYLKIAQGYYSSGSSEYQQIFNGIQEAYKSFGKSIGTEPSIPTEVSAFQNNNLALQQKTIDELLQIQTLLSALKGNAQGKLDEELAKLNATYITSKDELLAAAEAQRAQIEAAQKAEVDAINALLNGMEVSNGEQTGAVRENVNATRDVERSVQAVAAAIRGMPAPVVNVHPVIDLPAPAPVVPSPEHQITHSDPNLIKELKGLRSDIKQNTNLQLDKKRVG